MDNLKDDMQRIGGDRGSGPEAGSNCSEVTNVVRAPRNKQIIGSGSDLFFRLYALLLGASAVPVRITFNKQGLLSSTVFCHFWQFHVFA